jgi:hypothetical protein
MKNGVRLVAAFNEIAAVPFVIPTGAERSVVEGLQFCGLLLEMFFDGA